jgi:tRNA (guanine10-N2)-dimethyltransferase
MNYAKLRADNQFLALSELEALNGSPPLHHMNSVAIYEGNPRVAAKASFLKSSGKLLMITNDVSEVVSLLRGECVSLNLDVIMGSGRDKVRDVYTELSKVVKLSKRCNILELIFTEGLIVVGRMEAIKDSRSLREHMIRPFSQSGIMSSELSRLLVNLARPKEILLDPFVGTGSLLIESAWMGLQCVGIDAERNMLSKAKANLIAFGYSCHLINGSATNLPIVQVESIATDPPYGRSSKGWGAELKELYIEFFSSAYQSLKRGGFLVFSTDSRYDWRDHLREAGLRPLRLHYTYSHKNLSRAIYVVQRP